MSNKLLVLNVVGLSPKHLGPYTPHLTALAKQGCQTHIQPLLPAVTCSVQATYMTGLAPAQHGIVGNGWYMRDLCEVKFWHQSNRLLQGEQIWEALRRRDTNATSANIFWWYNMYCAADTAITVRPMYPADGRKIPDIYTSPAKVRTELTRELGPFPLFNFWGPKAGIHASRWIVDAALKTLEKSRPDLAMVYVPHLDYCLQKWGPTHPSIAEELKQVDALCGELINYGKNQGYSLVVLSEYGITEVNRVCHLNRLFREQGWIAVRKELGRELLDAEASRVFAVADHQVAHIYIQDRSLIGSVRRLLEQQEQIGLILDGHGKKDAGVAHSRSGELIAVAKPDAWFSYYYWLDDKHAPDFARTVDIHRKPGYDPVELFIDPAIKFPQVAVGWKLLKKKLGFRTLMDIIPLDAGSVKGSHGAISECAKDGAILICSEPGGVIGHELTEGVPATRIKNVLLDLVRPEREYNLNAAVL